MKKFFYGSLAALAVVAVSCSKDDGEYTTEFTCVTTNLVTNLSTGEVNVDPCAYRVKNEFSSGNATVSTTTLELGKKEYGMVLNAPRFASNIYNFENNGDHNMGQVVSIYDLSGSITNDPSLTVQTKIFTVSSLNFYHAYEPGSPTASPYNNVVVTQYNVGSQWLVKTFATDATYEGKTVTSYPDASGETQNYENEKMSYRFVMNLEENTAKMIIYDAKFASSMPIELSAIVVEGLDITWKSGSYEITGSDIVPFVYEGTNKVPYEAFTFNSIKFEPSNDSLTQGTLDYQVAGRYSATFTGKYLAEVQ